MIRRSLLRRVTRMSLRIGKKIGCGSAVIFRSPAIWRRKPTRSIGRKRLFSIIQRVQNSRRSMSLQTFMFNLGISWPSSFIHATMIEKRQSVLQESVDPVCGFSRGCKVSDRYRHLGSESRLEIRDVL